jgi:hypothetical protein
MAIISSFFGEQTPPAGVGGFAVGAEIPEELKPYYTDIMGKAQALYGQRTAAGYQPYTGPSLAPFSAEQEQAFTGLQGLVGGVAPKFAEAEELTRGAAAPITGEQIEEYMSPYQQAVVDIEKREAQKQFETGVVPQLAQQAAQAQAFGGSRQGILEGMAADTQQRLLADIQAKGSAQAYQDAVKRLEAERSRSGQAGAQLATMAPQQFKTQLGELGAVQTVGEERQKQTQAALNEAYRQFIKEQQYPYETMGKYQSVITGAPLAQTQYIQPQAQPSMTQQLLGGLGTMVGTYGAFGGFSPGGLFGRNAKTGGGIADLPVVYSQDSGGIGERLKNIAFPPRYLYGKGKEHLGPWISEKNKQLLEAMNWRKALDRLKAGAAIDDGAAIDEGMDWGGPNVEGQQYEQKFDSPSLKINTEIPPLSRRMSSYGKNIFDMIQKRTSPSYSTYNYLENIPEVQQESTYFRDPSGSPIWGVSGENLPPVEDRGLTIDQRALKFVKEKITDALTESDDPEVSGAQSAKDALKDVNQYMSEHYDRTIGSELPEGASDIHGGLTIDQRALKFVKEKVTNALTESDDPEVSGAQSAKDALKDINQSMKEIDALRQTKEEPSGLLSLVNENIKEFTNKHSENIRNILTKHTRIDPSKPLKDYINELSGVLTDTSRMHNAVDGITGADNNPEDFVLKLQNNILDSDQVDAVLDVIPNKKVIKKDTKILKDSVKNTDKIITLNKKKLGKNETTYQDALDASEDAPDNKKKKSKLDTAYDDYIAALETYNDSLSDKKTLINSAEKESFFAFLAQVSSRYGAGENLIAAAGKELPNAMKTRQKFIQARSDLDDKMDQGVVKIAKAELDIEKDKTSAEIAAEKEQRERYEFEEEQQTKRDIAAGKPNRMTLSNYEDSKFNVDSVFKTFANTTEKDPNFRTFLLNNSQIKNIDNKNFNDVFEEFIGDNRIQQRVWNRAKSDPKGGTFSSLDKLYRHHLLEEWKNLRGTYRRGKLFGVNVTWGKDVY